MPDADLKGSLKLGSYLKHLRLGYGYSLRKVEEKARLSGGEIDNSQLSRYEKGRCYPSFDKLRVLAGIFNVSIQSFSDVVDLESYEELRPEVDRFEDLLEAGNEQSLRGNYAHAYAAFQKAVEMVEEEGESGCADATTHLARARYGLARTLLKMGKISLGEYELRNVLRLAAGGDTAITIKTLLQLTNAHAEQGDRFLARLEAEKCLSLARQEEDTLSVAYSLHALGRIAYEELDHESALQYYRDALIAYEIVEDLAGCLLMKVQIGSTHVALSHHKVGMTLIQEALRVARQEGLRRVCALGVSELMQAYFARNDYARAKSCIREIDSLAGAESEDERYIDLLFNSAFYLWQMAREESNAIQEKIAFGRLKYLRSSLERTTAEVEKFDAHVGQGRGA